MRWKTMTPAQRGAYWQLICWQMQGDDGHLPAEVHILSSLADLDLSNGNGCILDAFPLQPNGRRANPRALREWNKRRAISGVRSEIGSAGIAKRWQGHSKPIAIAISDDSKPIAIAATSTTTTTDTARVTSKKVERPRKRVSQLIEIPDKLKSLPGWDAAWKAWIEHRRVKKSPVTDRVAATVLSRLSERPGQAIAALDTCMVAGWSDVRWDWIDNRNTSQPATPRNQPPELINTFHQKEFTRHDAF
jgi:hypothetical protein